MTWTKLGTEFFDSPGMLAVDRDARLVHVETMIWCNAQGTDGRIPRHALRKITDSSDPDAAVDQLIAAGEWESTEAGWQIVKFLKGQGGHQPSVAQVERNNKANAARVARSRAHAEGDHSECLPDRYCRRGSNAVTDGVSAAARPPARPTDRQGGREGVGSKARSAPSSAGAPSSAARDVEYPQIEPEQICKIGEWFELSYSGGSIYFELNEDSFAKLSTGEYQDLFGRLMNVKHEIASRGDAEIGPGIDCNSLEIVANSDKVARSIWVDLQRMVTK